MTGRPGDDFRAGMPLMTFQGPEDSDFAHSDEEEDPLESVLNRMKYRPQMQQPHDFWPSVLLSGGLCLVLGFVLSYVAFLSAQRSMSQHHQVVKEVNHEMGSFLGSLATASNINNFISELHKEGPSGEVKRLSHHFLGEGFDNVNQFNYTTLSFKPDPLYSNKVSLLNNEGMVHMSAFLNVSTTTADTSNDIMGQLVYVGRGLAEDWLTLEQANVAIQGQIVIASTSSLYPEDIAAASYERGAAALLLYSPQQANFPFWFPHSVSPGVGGLYQESQGFQLPVASLETKDAETILRVSMSRVNDEDGWQEGTPGKAHHGSLRLNLHTSPHISPIFNVVAILGGTLEPDRYVIIGAHRTGARNGTAALMELAKMFGKLKNTKGWRPRRTLILASWGGEGVTGTATFVSQFDQSLHARAIAYIDIHHVTRGAESAQIQGSPILQKLLGLVSPFIPDMSALLDHTKSGFQMPGHRSNCPPFIHNAGIPCFSLLFSNHSTLLSSVKVGSVVAWFLAEVYLLPYDVTAFSSAVATRIASLNSLYDAMLKEHNLTLRSLETAASMLAETANKFQQHLDKTTIHTDVQLRELNDQLNQLSESLLLPHDNGNRDAFAWPSSVAEASSGSGFGFLHDLLAACASPSHSAEHARALKLQHYTSQLARLLESAARLLLPPTQLS